MHMRLRDKFQLLVIGLLLALTAAFAIAAFAMPPVETAALSPASFELPSTPEHAPCLKPHHPCGQGGIAPAPAGSVALHAMPDAGLVKVPALLPPPLPDVAPHAAASLSILFRNFRE